MEQNLIIGEINKLLEAEKMTRKSVYENLLSKGIVKPNSERIVTETIDYGVQEGLIAKNRLIWFRKKSGKLPVTFTIEQVVNIFDRVDRPKVAVAIWLGLFCGLRVSEVCNLRVADLDLVNRRVFVRDSKNSNRSKQGYGKDRIVTLPEIAVSPLKKWLEIIQGGEWLFPSMSQPNKPILEKTILEQYRYLLRTCGLDEAEYVTSCKARIHGKRRETQKTVHKYRFHTLRHTYATYLLEKGVPLEHIQKSLGHNQIDTTLIYAKVSNTKTAQLVDEAFSVPLRLTSKDSFLNKPAEERKENVISNVGADEILKQRLARGEIDIITYKRLLAEINPEKTINVIHTVKDS
ncbi:tyrosine-type recombinase/integrase [Candidatus Woesearchaeota archaeon]|nr:tyrosine-type recombinase/integrase [Candidatus Woesearchaeota archaeon]